MIAVKDLWKVYRLGWIRPRPIPAVRGLSICIRTGEVFGLLGPNGAGKTTTVRLVCGLVHPTSGAIIVDEVPVTARPPSTRPIGAVLEGNRNIYWNLSCWENIMYFARTRGVRIAEARSRAEALLTDFSLLAKRRDPAGSLSRGMQQKLSLCCALISDPSVLLLDEPTLGLDVASAAMIRDRIRDLSGALSKTILLTTHNMELAASACDRVGIMNHGRLVQSGTVSEFRSLVSSVRVHLELKSPLTDSLCKALRQMGCVRVESMQDGHSISIEAASTEQFPVGILATILRSLDEEGIPLTSVSTRQPSLEEVFVRLTEGDGQ